VKQKKSVNWEAATWTFGQLCPPGTTDRAVAALTFYKILKTKKLGKLTTKQEEDFGAITISEE
jgi:hypothetical protein